MLSLYTLYSLCWLFFSSLGVISYHNISRKCRVIQNASLSFSSETYLIGHMSAAMSLLSYLDFFNPNVYETSLPQSIAIGLAGGNLLKHCQYQLHRLKCHLELVLKKLFLRSSLKYRRRTSSPYFCPFHGSYSEHFQLKWFFDNWHEHLWHDTEVLIAER